MKLRLVFLKKHIKVEEERQNGQIAQKFGCKVNPSNDGKY